MHQPTLRLKYPCKLKKFFNELKRRF